MRNQRTHKKNKKPDFLEKQRNTMESKKILAVAGIEITDRVRILKPGKVVIDKLTGCIPLNGGSGEGKSTLLELLKMATVGIDTRRDNNLLVEGQEQAEFLVPIAYVDKPNEVLLYIRTVIKNSGEIKQTFMVDTEKGRKAEKEPIPGVGTLTPSKLQELMKTTLTYGIDDFLSESPTKVRDFIYKTFSEELSKKGLLVEKSSPLYAKSVNGRLDAALAERDDVSREQSKKGAYAVNLEGLVKPMKPDMQALEESRQKAIQELANGRAKISSLEERKQASISECKAKQQLALKTADGICEKIAAWNRERQQEEHQVVDQIESYIALTNKMIESVEQFKASMPKNINCDMFLHELASAINFYTTSKENRPEVQQINIQSPEKNEGLPEEAVALYLSMIDAKKQVEAFEQSMKSIEATTEDSYEERIKALENELVNCNEAIEQAKQTHELAERFEILERHREAEEKVARIRSERNQLFTQVNCFVPGLFIGLVDEEKGTMAFFYNGSYDPAYFGNPDKKPQLLTSYSASQKIFIGAMLQSFLMKQNALPLNVLYVDNVGMDNKVKTLYDGFAKKNGLMILVAQTNDKTLSEIGNNELLIENGELFIGEAK